MAGEKFLIETQCKYIKVLVMLSAVLAPSLLDAQQQDESTVIYEAGYFAQYNPTTLTDMIRYIPGGETILNRRYGSGGSNYRGFGASDSQVLVNGRRMSGKIKQHVDSSG